MKLAAIKAVLIKIFAILAAMASAAGPMHLIPHVLGGTVPVVATQGIAIQGSTAKYISSLNLYWSTPDGNLSPGQYGADETGNFLWVYYPATTSTALLLKEPKTADTTGFIQENYMGLRGVDYYTASDNSISQQIITEQEYRNEATQTSLKTTIVQVPIVGLLTPKADAATVTVIGGSDTGALSDSNTSAHTSTTFSVVIPSSGQNELFVWMGNGNAVTSSTLGGSTMTDEGITDGVCAYRNLAFKTAPLTGSQSLVINFGSTSNKQDYRGITLQDSSGFDVRGVFGQNSTSISKQITTTANGDMVMGGGGFNGTSVANTWSATDIMLSQGQGDNTNISWSYLPQTTAGNITASYSETGAQCLSLLVVSFKYQAPPAASNSSVNGIILFQ